MSLFSHLPLIEIATTSMTRRFMRCGLTFASLNLHLDETGSHRGLERCVIRLRLIGVGDALLAMGGHRVSHGPQDLACFSMLLA
jgi:hypothetical protein